MALSPDTYCDEKCIFYNLCSLWDPSPSSQQWDDFIDLKYNLRFHEFLESDIQQLLNWIQENIAFWGICLLWRFTKGGLIFAMKTRISGNFYILHRLQKKAHYYEVSNRNDGKLAPVLVPTGSSPFPRPLIALSHSSSPRLPSVSKKSIYYIFHKTGLIFEADVDMRDLWAAVEEEKYGWASNWPRLNNNPLYKDVPNLVERGKSMAM